MHVGFWRTHVIFHLFFTKSFVSSVFWIIHKSMFSVQVSNWNCCSFQFFPSFCSGERWWFSGQSWRASKRASMHSLVTSLCSGAHNRTWTHFFYMNTWPMIIQYSVSNREWWLIKLRFIREGRFVATVMINNDCFCILY